MVGWTQDEPSSWWLATSDEPEAHTSGGYWHHHRRGEPHAAVHDERFQDELLAELGRFTGASLATAVSPSS